MCVGGGGGGGGEALYWQWEGHKLNVNVHPLPEFREIDNENIPCIHTLVNKKGYCLRPGKGERLILEFFARTYFSPL